MVDALALGASAVRHEGSSPFLGTKNNERNVTRCVIYFLPRKGLELSPKRSQFCSQNCEDEAGSRNSIFMNVIHEVKIHVW